MHTDTANRLSVLDDLCDDPESRPEYIQCGFRLRIPTEPKPEQQLSQSTPSPQTTTQNAAAPNKKKKAIKEHLKVVTCRASYDSGISLSSPTGTPARGNSADSEHNFDIESIVFDEADGARPIRFGRYKLVDSQQSGVTATVFAALDYYTGEKVALKILNQADDRQFRHAENECNVLQQIGPHRNIVALKGMSVQKGGRIAIATEFVGPDLFDVLVSRQWVISPRDFLDYAVQLSSAVQHMHRQGFAHRDIKPENVCLTNDGIIKLVDFGVARHVDAPGHIRRQAGTAGFMAPEQLGNIDRTKLQLLPTDIFALGITFFNLLTGGVPFNDAAEFDPEYRLFLRGAHVRSRRKGAAWRMIPKQLRPLIYGMLEANPTMRWTIDEVLDYLEHVRDNAHDKEAPLPPVPMRKSASQLSISSIMADFSSWLRTNKKSGWR